MSVRSSPILRHCILTLPLYCTSCFRYRSGILARSSAPPASLQPYLRPALELAQNSGSRRRALATRHAIITSPHFLPPFASARARLAALRIGHLTLSLHRINHAL